MSNRHEIRMMAKANYYQQKEAYNRIQSFKSLNKTSKTLFVGSINFYAGIYNMDFEMCNKGYNMVVESYVEMMNKFEHKEYRFAQMDLTNLTTTDIESTDNSYLTLCNDMMEEQKKLKKMLDQLVESNYFTK